MLANLLKMYVCVCCVCGIGAFKKKQKNEIKVSWIVFSGCWCWIISPIRRYDICFTLLTHIFSKVSQLGLLSRMPISTFSNAYFFAHSCLWFGFFWFHYSIFPIFNLIIFLSSSLSLNRHPMCSTRNQPRLNSLALVNWSSPNSHLNFKDSCSVNVVDVIARQFSVLVCVYNQPCFSICCGYSFAFLLRYLY